MHADFKKTNGLNVNMQERKMIETVGKIQYQTTEK